MDNWQPIDDAELERLVRAEEEEYRKARGNDNPDPLIPIDPATLDGMPIPQRQWLVPDWIPMSRATSLYGAGGEGKTLLTQMLATCCAIGAKWLGLPVRRCNSLLMFCEDDLDEMHRRQEDINRHYGCTFADLSAMRWLPRLGEDNVLMTFENGRAHRTSLFDQLLAASIEHNAGLVITDTLADVFSGNESDRGQARMFAQSVLGHIARETGAASLTLAHPSLTGMANGSTGSGSTGWKGTFRSQLYLETPNTEEGEQPDPNVRVLRRAKANYASRNDTIEVKWQAGVFVPLHAPTGIIGSIEKRTSERIFLDILDATTTEGQPVSSNSRSGNYAPRLFAKRPRGQRQGFKAADFAAAMQVLFATRPPTIINQPYGRKGDERTRLARNPEAPAPAAVSGGSF
jgi:RecA-family ATPase